MRTPGTRVTEGAADRALTPAPEERTYLLGEQREVLLRGLKFSGGRSEVGPSVIVSDRAVCHVRKHVLGLAHTGEHFGRRHFHKVGRAVVVALRAFFPSPSGGKAVKKPGQAGKFRHADKSVFGVGHRDEAAYLREALYLSQVAGPLSQQARRFVDLKSDTLNEKNFVGCRDNTDRSRRKTGDFLVGGVLPHGQVVQHPEVNPGALGVCEGLLGLPHLRGRIGERVEPRKFLLRCKQVRSPHFEFGPDRTPVTLCKA